MPKGAPFNRTTISVAVRHLHLAFKGLETEEIYDVLMEQFLKAVKKYDPRYSLKVKLLIEKIEEEFLHAKSFTAADLNDYLDFDSDRYLRMLCRRGFLASRRQERGEKKITVFKRTGEWPPPASLYEDNIVGFAYYIQTWFRYYLQNISAESGPPDRVARRKLLRVAYPERNRHLVASTAALGQVQALSQQ